MGAFSPGVAAGAGSERGQGLIPFPRGHGEPVLVLDVGPFGHVVTVPSPVFGHPDQIVGGMPVDAVALVLVA